jgi:hypothetical protein
VCQLLVAPKYLKSPKNRVWNSRKIGAALDIDHIFSGAYMTEDEALCMETIWNSRSPEDPCSPDK